VHQEALQHVQQGRGCCGRRLGFLATQQHAGVGRWYHRSSMCSVLGVCVLGVGVTNQNTGNQVGQGLCAACAARWSSGAACWLVVEGVSCHSCSPPASLATCGYASDSWRGWGSCLGCEQLPVWRMPYMLLLSATSSPPAVLVSAGPLNWVCDRGHACQQSSRCCVVVRYMMCLSGSAALAQPALRVCPGVPVAWSLLGRCASTPACTHAPRSVAPPPPPPTQLPAVWAWACPGSAVQPGMPKLCPRVPPGPCCSCKAGQGAQLSVCLWTQDVQLCAGGCMSTACAVAMTELWVSNMLQSKTMCNLYIN
jgi:hypothetical protein